MERSKQIYYLDKAINGIIFAVLLAVPLYFNIFSFLAFEVDKLVLFRIGVELLILLYGWKAIIQKKIVLSHGSIWLFIVPILLVMCLSTAFSDLPWVSFWGTYRRQLGLFTWFHIFVFFYFLYDRLRWEPPADETDKINMLVLLRACLYPFFLVAIYALVQVAGFDPVSWQGFAGMVQERATSTLGQPNYLASYLLLLLPAAVFFMSEAEAFRSRIFFAVISLSGLAALISTYSRAAWIGLLGAAGFYISLYVWRKGKRYFLILLATVLLAAYALCYYNATLIGPSAAGQELSVLGRIKSMFVFQEATVSLRALYYGASLDLIKDDPIWGKGLDAQSYSFYRYYQPVYAVYEKVNSYNDRAHNEILDILITTGFMGLLAWLLFLGFLARASWKARISDPGSTLNRFIWFGLISYLISIQFGFHTAVNLIYCFFLLSLSGAIVLSRQKREFTFDMKRFLSVYLLILLGLGAVSSVWFFNIRFIHADQHIRQAKVDMYRHQPFSALEEYDRAIALSPRTSAYRVFLAEDMLPIFSDSGSPAEKIHNLEYILEVLNGSDPRYDEYENRLEKAVVWTHLIRARSEKQDIGTEAEQIEQLFIALAGLAPGYARVYYEWGNLYHAINEPAKALEMYEKALTKYPNLNHPGMNKEHRELVANELVMVWQKMIELKIRAGDYIAAKKTAEQWSSLRPGDMRALDVLNQIDFAQKKKDLVIARLRHMAVLDPGNDRIWHQLALFYKENGQIEDALSSGTRALEIRPDPLYQEFLKNLEKGKK